MAWQQARGVRAGRCARAECRGLWFEFGQLDALTGHPASLEALEGDTSRRCPSCAITLTTVLLSSSIPVETCSICRGIYLDHGELQEFAGARLAMSEGNLLASGLACRSCTPQPNIRPGDAERSYRGRDPFGTPYRPSDLTLLLDLFDDVFKF